MRNLVSLAMLAAFPLAAGAQGALEVKSLAATCANCHGTNGHSATDVVPSIAGLPREHLERQLRAFRSGERPATVMDQLARGYTDEQISALAAYFSSQKKGTP